MRLRSLAFVPLLLASVASFGAIHCGGGTTNLQTLPDAGGPSGGEDGGAGDPDAGPVNPDATGATTSSKVDLLLVVDNSASMGDKAKLLGASLDPLLRKVATAGDVHVGVITSSLGTMGGDICADERQGGVPRPSQHGGPRRRAARQCGEGLPLVRRGRRVERRCVRGRCADARATASVRTAAGSRPSSRACIASWSSPIRGRPPRSTASNLSQSRRHRRHAARAAEGVPATRLARRGRDAHRRGRLRRGSAQRRRPGLGLHEQPVPGLAGLPRRRQDDDRAARDERVRQRSRLARLHVVRLRGDVQRVGPGVPEDQERPGVPEERRLLRADRGSAQRPLPAHEGAVRHRPAVPDLSLRRRLHQGKGAQSSWRARRRAAQTRIGAYVGTPTCTNPLFAASLPSGSGEELCNLPKGPRGKDLVVFALIGGVPEALAGAAPELDEDPRHEPRRVQLPGDRSAHDPVRVARARDCRRRRPRAVTTARTRSTAASGTPPRMTCSMHAPSTLPTPRTCTAQDTSCDCADPSRNPPLCGATLGQQVRGKAYPTVRELRVVKELGERGIARLDLPDERRHGLRRDDDDAGRSPGAAHREVAPHIGSSAAHREVVGALVGAFQSVRFSPCRGRRRTGRRRRACARGRPPPGGASR